MANRDDDIMIDDLPDDVVTYVDRPRTNPIEATRENMRGKIALCLFGLLAAEVILGLIIVACIASGPSPQNAKIVTEWLTSVVTGTIALLGAATGFYFGTRAS